MKKLRKIGNTIYLSNADGTGCACPYMEAKLETKFQPQSDIAAPKQLPPVQITNKEQVTCSNRCALFELRSTIVRLHCSNAEYKKEFLKED